MRIPLYLYKELEVLLMKSSKCYLYMAFLFIILLVPMWAELCRGAERDDLKVLYNSTSGESWTNNSGWKEPPWQRTAFQQQVSAISPTHGLE
jgi:hypothetical protein